MGKIMKKVDKLAVFDLDGTLWKENSHIVILNQYYKTVFFNSYISKAIALIFPKLYMNMLFNLYNRIPEEYIGNFSLPFRNSAIELLEQKKQEGYQILIISNAPKSIVSGAAKRLNLQFYRAEIGKKDTVLKEIYKWNKLFVCTDNSTDINIIHLADTCILYTNKNNYKLFQTLNNATLNKEDL
jgi:phosphoserine phosphatase